MASNHRTGRILKALAIFCAAIVVAAVMLEAGLHLFYLGFSPKPRVIAADYGQPMLFDLVYRLAPGICVSTRYVSPQQRDWPNAYCINDDGFRGKPVAKEKGSAFRIAILGDSFVFGSGVNDDQTLSAQLEALLQARLPGAEVLNFGTPGYTTMQEVEWFMRYGRQFQPDVVVLALAVLDHTRPCYWSPFWADLGRRSILIGTIQRFWYIHHVQTVNPEARLALQYQAIDALLKNADQAGAGKRPIVCLALLTAGENTTAIAYHYLSQGVCVADLRRIDDEITRRNFRIPKDIHPTAPGYALFAKALAPVVLSVLNEKPL